MSQNSVQQWGGPFPSLHMWPVPDTFVMKMIHLPPGQRIKIGRQTNAKTSPAERNGYFDSKVLSRLHAEVWESGGRVYIKDIKSSNGTFVNGDRLSPEGIESDACELHNGDIVEFGIDIVSEDNRTVVHHKVAAKVYCVLTPEDALISAREMRGYRRGAAPAAAAPQAFSSGGKAAGITFENVLQKLQAELAQSKDTEADLQGLSTAMTDIQDTLGGGVAPSQNGSATEFIPPQYRNSTEAQAALKGPHGQQAAAFISLQDQLAETQASLNAHIERIRTLESNLDQQHTIQLEIRELREQIDKRDERDDDTSSVLTVMDHSREVIMEENNKLSDKVQSLSTEVTDAVQLSQRLQAQHGEAMAAMRTLTERVENLESGIAKRIADAVAETEKKWDTWRAAAEDRWRQERESWDAERERMRGVVRDWEEASRRANEEEEERELNESSDEEIKPSGRRKPRRRRGKANLAVQALREMSDGASTPKLATMHLEKPKVIKRSGSATTVQADKESQESDSQSGDTLHDGGDGAVRERPVTTVPIITVFIVAAVAGAIYYHQRD